MATVLKKRNLPRPPSPLPWFTLGSAMVLLGLYALFRGWAWMGWIVLALSPFVSAILPMEINDFLRRKRICEHIRRDFLEDSEMVHDHKQFLSALHEDRVYPLRRSRFRRSSSRSDWARSSPSRSSSSRTG